MGFFVMKRSDIHHYRGQVAAAYDGSDGESGTFKPPLRPCSGVQRCEIRISGHPHP